jgi:hypothetical protein
MKYGYARVSTDGQNANLQHAALEKAGAKRIYTDDGDVLKKKQRTEAALPSQSRSPESTGRTAANGARSGLVQGSNRPLASCIRSFRRAGIQSNLEKQG